jgi:hypothetical protein
MKALGEMTDAAHLSTIPRFVEMVSRHAANAGYSEARVADMAAAVEEALTNLAEFGCGKEGEAMTVKVGDDNGKRFVIDIADSGTSFNMLLEADPFLSGAGPTERRPSTRRMKRIGDVEYKRFEGKNHTVITVYPVKTGPAGPLG